MERKDRPRGENLRQLGADLPLARRGEKQDVRPIHSEGAGDLGRVYDRQGQTTGYGGAPQSVTDTITQPKQQVEELDNKSQNVTAETTLTVVIEQQRSFKFGRKLDENPRPDPLAIALAALPPDTSAVSAVQVLATCESSVIFK